MKLHGNPQAGIEEIQIPKNFPPMILDGKVILPITHRLRKKYLIFRVYEDPI